tara:strand:- start:448 stop:615 length:168 start_codon:yes stop_codon:yes gene_type:complete
LGENLSYKLYGDLSTNIGPPLKPFFFRANAAEVAVIKNLYSKGINADSLKREFGY